MTQPQPLHGSVVRLLLAAVFIVAAWLVFEPSTNPVQADDPFDCSSAPCTFTFEGTPGFTNSGLWHYESSAGIAGMTAPMLAFNEECVGPALQGCNYSTGAAVSGTSSTPDFTIPAGGGQLTFKLALLRENTCGANDRLSLLETSGTTDDLGLGMASISPGAISIVNDGFCGSSATPQIVTVPLPAGTTRIGFMFDSRDQLGNNFAGVFIDDVTIGPVPQSCAEGCGFGAGEDWTTTSLWHIESNAQVEGMTAPMLAFNTGCTGPGFDGCNYDQGHVFGFAASPLIAVPTGFVLTFDLALQREPGSGCGNEWDRLTVATSTDGNNLIPLDLSAAGATIGFGSVSFVGEDFCGDSASALAVTVPLPEGTNRVAFIFNSIDETVNNYPGVFIDNIAIAAPPPPPLDCSVEGACSFGFDLPWGYMGGLWHIESAAGIEGMASPMLAFNQGCAGPGIDGCTYNTGHATGFTHSPPLTNVPGGAVLTFDVVSNVEPTTCGSLFYDVWGVLASVDGVSLDVIDLEGAGATITPGGISIVGDQFCGSSSTPQTVTVPLPNGTQFVGFQFDSIDGDSNNFAGVFIDNLAIGMPIPPPLDCSIPGECEFGFDEPWPLMETLWHIESNATIAGLSSPVLAYNEGCTGPGTAGCTYNTGDANEGGAVSPVMSVPEGYELRFDLAMLNEDTCIGADSLVVRVSVNGGPFELVDLTQVGATISPGTMDIVDALVCRSSETPQTVTVPLPPGDIAVELFFSTFDAIDNNHAGVFLDNVVVAPAPPPPLDCTDEDAPCFFDFTGPWPDVIGLWHSESNATIEGMTAPMLAFNQGCTGPGLTGCTFDTGLGEATGLARSPELIVPEVAELSFTIFQDLGPGGGCGAAAGLYVQFYDGAFWNDVPLGGVGATISAGSLSLNDWYFCGVSQDPQMVRIPVPAGTTRVAFGISVPDSENAGVFIDDVRIGTPLPPEFGLLRVVTSPAVPASIYVDGILRNSWGLNWMKFPPGTYTLSFGDVPGFATPAPQEITVSADQTTAVTGNFTWLGNLHVITSPPVPSTISINGIPRDNWGPWLDLPAGTYDVCFGPVVNFIPPPCQEDVVVNGNGATTEITGVFTPSPGQPGAIGTGLLRVVTTPAAPSTIYVDGIARDAWGLDWMDMAPGTYTVSFSSIPGYATPAPQQVVVTAAQTTTVNGTFTQLAPLHIITSPAVPSTLFVDGIERDDWGVFTTFLPGTYIICFGPVSGFITPNCQEVMLTAGVVTDVTGTFVPE